MTDQVKNLMDRLGISEEEALDVIKTDLAIDQGADPFPLTEEQKKVAKSHTISTSAERVYTFKQTTRKADEDKRELIQILASALADFDEVEITNQEREITFSRNGRKFKIVLSAPRS